VRVLFVDPFFDGSHRAFGEGLARHSRHDIELLTLPGGEWRRRMRRGAQELARASRDLAGDFDAMVATDMLDLPAFLALTRPRFERVPVMVYFHENQLTYPRLRGTKLNSWFGAMNYLSALTADTLAFNSAYHRDDFLGALRTLERGPNNWLDIEGVVEIETKASVLPVGVELSGLLEGETSRTAVRGSDPVLLWNHRWEFDKAPDVFARAMQSLAAEGAAFQVAIAGEPGDNPHPALLELRDALGERVVHFGPAQRREDYAALLRRSDIVVSTTRHEFFGVGMVEALAAGCLPVAPNRYNYPALIPVELHERFLWDDETALLNRLRTTLDLLRESPLLVSDIRGRLGASICRFAWDTVAPLWDAAISELADLTASSASRSP
jgi:glycosyltransferase involved in cell wall biosynthesis